MLTEERTVNSIIKAALLPKLYEFFIIIIFGIKKSKFSAKVKWTKIFRLTLLHWYNKDPFNLGL